jgi:adenylate cyclase
MLGVAIASDYGYWLTQERWTEIAGKPVFRLNALITDTKFKLRGRKQVQNKIVIVEINSEALEQPELGRWPWNRDKIAFLIDSIMGYGAKVVGLDIVFSEEERLMPAELRQRLEDMKLGQMLQGYQNDEILAKAVGFYRDRLVLGWTADVSCHPHMESECQRAIRDPGVSAARPIDLGSFALSRLEMPREVSADQWFLRSAIYTVSNIPRLNQVARHQGFLDGYPDADGIVRRMPLLTGLGDALHPAFSLRMATAATGTEPEALLDRSGRLVKLNLGQSLPEISSSSSSALALNYRGHYPSFDRVPVLAFFDGSTGVETDGVRREFPEIFKDAFVVLAVTATALGDLRNTPYDVGVPGVEIHATVLDNILSGDALKTEATNGRVALGSVLLLLSLSAFAAGLAGYFSGWTALAAWVLPFPLLAATDYWFFANLNVNFQSGPHYLTLGALAFYAGFRRFQEEEKKREFIRSAFTRYIDPNVVDELIRDPEKLSLGMRSQELTVLFCDLRGFTTLSEKLDGPVLSDFLNDYYELLTTEIHSERGTFDKFIGDALMAFWGAPLADPDHRAGAIRAAVAMRRAFEKNRDRFENHLGSKVDVGFGVNSGVAQVGNVGSYTNFNYTVLGDAVNLASRLEGMSKQYGCPILTTLETLNQSGLKDDPTVAWRMIDRVQVKGKTKGVDVVELATSPYPPGFLEITTAGFSSYFAREWEKAQACFRDAQIVFAEAVGHPDRATDILLSHIEHFKTQAPPPGWDGSWVLKEK